MELIAEILTMILEHMVLHHICEWIEHKAKSALQKVGKKNEST